MSPPAMVPVAPRAEGNAWASAPSERAPAASPSARFATVLDAPQAQAFGHAPRILVSILKDGTDGQIHRLDKQTADLGRSEGDIILSDDPYMSPRHARVVAHGENGLMVRDLDSVNGVYVRVREPVDVIDGDVILVGQQVLRFELLAESELPLGPASQRGTLIFGTPEVQRVARLMQYTTEGIVRDVHYLYRDETILGREQGDVVFTDDPFLSRRHAAITIERANKRFILRDLGSSNGTSIRIRGEKLLRPTDQFRVGRHLFRFDMGA